MQIVQKSHDTSQISQDLRLQNAQSLLQSTETKSSENGRYAIVADKTGADHFEFIPEKGFQMTVGKDITQEQRLMLAEANRPASHQFVVMQLSRLALHKHMRAGESTASAFFSDLASDIAGSGELAVVESCARLRRSESPFYPNSAEIIKMVERVSFEISANLSPKISYQKPEQQKVPDWRAPTDAEKQKVADIVAQAIKHLGAA